MTFLRYNIRLAGIDDIEPLVEHRISLIRERGGISDESMVPDLTEANRKYFLDMIPKGQFVAWLAEANGEIVGTSGLVFFARPPHAGSLSGLEAYIMNMYTIPQARGMGIAAALLTEIIQYVKKTSARRIFLHARSEGRALYMQAGFTPTDVEMELTW